MQTVLITGGCGFVGSSLALHLREVLAPSVRLIAMDNFYRKGSELNAPRLTAAGIEVHRGDVRHAKEFPEAPIDLLIECSAEPSVLAGTGGDVDYLFDTNLVGAYRCLEKCRRDGAGMIFLSTSRVYPVTPLETHPWVEAETRFHWLQTGGPIGPEGVSESLPMDGARSLYGYTKLSAEQLIEEYRAAFGLRAVVNRCGVLAGPWQFGKVDQGVIALWVMAHLFDRPLAYVGYGGQGKQVRDVLHVADLCRLIEMQVRDLVGWDGWNGNVSGGLAQSTSLLELTRLCGELTGRPRVIPAGPASRPFDLRIYLGDCARLHARTDWRPRLGVTSVVEDTVRWVHDHAEVLRSL